MSSSYNVSEKAGSVSVTVQRTGNLNQYAIVLCRTRQGTASSGISSQAGQQDYVEYAGQVGGRAGLYSSTVSRLQPGLGRGCALSYFSVLHLPSHWCSFSSNFPLSPPHSALFFTLQLISTELTTEVLPAWLLSPCVLLYNPKKFARHHGLLSAFGILQIQTYASVNSV